MTVSSLGGVCGPQEDDFELCNFPLTFVVARVKALNP